MFIKQRWINQYASVSEPWMWYTCLSHQQTEDICEKDDDWHGAGHRHEQAHEPPCWS